MKKIYALLTILLSPAISPALIYAQETAVNYTPHFDGTVKARFEVSAYDGGSRFNVRNARFGVAGNAAERIHYRFQVDYSYEGSFMVLDAYAGYRHGGWDFMLGQLPYRFSSDVLRAPNTNLFANRSFIAKYITGYYGDAIVGGGVDDFVRNLGGRDIGATLAYSFIAGIPVKITLGALNGSGMSNPQWSDRVNFLGRLDFTITPTLTAGVSYYTGSTPVHSHMNFDPATGLLRSGMIRNHMEMLDAELSFKSGDFAIDAEYAQRMLREECRHMLTAAHVFSSYKFNLPTSRFAQYLMPVLRWDVGDNVDYLNLETLRREGFTSNRITAGLNLGFKGATVRSELRLNYEKYLIGRRPSDYSANIQLQDKFTVEILVVF